MSIDNQNNPSLATARASGLLLIAFGVMVLLGWFTQSVLLVAVVPGFAPMQANTAVCFILSGAALLAAVKEQNRTVSILGSIIATIGALAFLQHSQGWNLGIDQLIIKPFYSERTPMPGRMSAMTSICFFLSGIALVVRSKEQQCRNCQIVLSTLASIVLGLALTALCTLWLDVEGLQGWRRQTGQMALLTSICFLALSVGLFGLAWYRARQERKALPHWLPLPIGIFGLAISVCVYLMVLSSQHIQEEQATEQHLESIRVLISNAVEERMAALDQMARRWEANGGTPEKLWEMDATNYIRNLKGFQAIQWIDANLIVRRCVPLKGNEAVIGINLGKNPARAPIYERSRARGKLTFTPAINLIQGGRGFLVHVPLVVNGRPDGFIVGVFRSQDFLGDVIRPELLKNYSLFIYEAEKELYRSERIPLGRGRDLVRRMDLQLPGTTWQMMLEPIEPEMGQSYLAGMVLGIGGFISLLLSIVTFFAQTAYRRTAELLVGNQKLSAEVLERRRVEEELRRLGISQKAILSSANYSVIATTMDGVITSFNVAAEKMLGYTADEMVGKQTPKIIHLETEVLARSKELSKELGRDIEPGFETFVARARSGTTDEREWTYVRKDGT